MGMLEFIEPRFGLKMVSGHEAAKRWLSEDARLLKEGHLSALPMGYLICGPVGTGKSFLVTCAAGEIGIPLVRLKNFRSMWVGATEGNLEKILGTLRSLGPVGVVVDEADAALGSRRQAGDSGVSSRVFGMIAEQMGNTDYRGRILWFLLTARPDYLPIDLKRQGRAEVHIPLLYPETPEQVADMVRVMAKKNDAPIADPDQIKIPPDKKLSGSDIEGIVVRANRRRLLEGRQAVDAEELNDEIAKFPQRTDDPDIRLQTLAAVYECTHKEFLPESYRSMDRAEVLAEIQSIKRSLGES
jgi:SpoVK/Ycf46/Vps4 family AAA+-type ATPase